MKKQEELFLEVKDIISSNQLHIRQQLLFILGRGIPTPDSYLMLKALLLSLMVMRIMEYWLF